MSLAYLMNEQATGQKKPLIFYGWIIVAISLVTMTIAYATRFSFSVFYVAILEEFGWSRAETALAFSINLIVYASLSPLSGTLIDRFGPRRIFPIGAVICGLGLLGLSQIASILQLYLFSGLMAVGLVLMGYVAHSCFLPHWFSLKLGTALGFAVIGLSLGNVSSLPIQHLINSIGWRGVYIILSIVVVAVIVPLTAIFQRHRARDMGLPLDGITSPKDEPEAGTKGPARGAETDRRIVDKEWAATDWTLSRAMKTTRFWLLFMQTFLTGISYNIILVHTVAFIVDVGYSKILAASVFALLGGVSIVSAFGGYISDRIGRELTYTIGSLGLVVAILVLLLVRDTSAPWMLYSFAILFGVCQGVDRPIIMAAKADIFHGKHLGTIMGFNNLGYGFGGALGAWLAGYIFDVQGSYTLAFITSLVTLIGTLALMWWAAPRKVRVVGGKISQEPAYH